MEEEVEKKPKKKTKKKKKKSKKIDPKKFNLKKEIEKDKYFPLDPVKRDMRERKFILNNLDKNVVKFMFLGQMCSFDYYTPLLKKDLEYYDAKPVILVFGRFNTKEGEKRILGFNLHYYPPKIRYNVMDRIYRIYKSVYSNNFEDGLNKDISSIEYKMLMEQLQKAKLDFGVREYVPTLIKNLRVIPPQYFPKAILTEGYFKKKTRDAIMNYWSKFGSTPKTEQPPEEL